VIITGTGFTDASSVDFGGIPALEYAVGKFNHHLLEHAP